MKRLKNFLGAASLAAAMAATGCTYVINVYSTTPGAGTGAPHQTQQIDERPHYLQSLPPQEVIDAMTPLQKRVESLMQLSGAREEQDNPFPVYMNGCARADLDIHGSTVHLFLPFYTSAGEGKWRYRPDNTLVDSQPILADLEAVFEDAVNLAYEEYAKHSERTNAVVERVFPNASGVKNTPIPGTGLTYNDIFGLIDLEKANFLPDGANIIFAPDESGIYAITQLERNTILYTPDARRSDAIWGRAWVLAHELVHNNTILQNMPNLLEMDLELQAYTLDIANRSNLFLFLKHVYGSQVREAALRYFGVDASKIYDNLVKLKFNNYIEMDEQYLMQMAPTIVNMVDTFHGVMMEKALPEYQGFMPWWLMAEAYFRNDSLPLEVGAAARFNPITLTPQQMLKITQDRQKIDRMIDNVREDYKMPEVASFFGMTFTRGDTFEDAVYKKAKIAGYDKQQCDYIYDLAMERIFISGDGINYGALSVPNAIQGMDDFMGIFDKFMDEENDERPRFARDIASKPDVIRRYAAYQWMQDRLETAARYIRISENAGRHPDVRFNPAIFDPRTDVTTMYRVTPEYADNVTSSPLETRTLETTAGNYRMETFDLVSGLEFSSSDNGVDFVRVFHEGDSRPRIVAFAQDNKFGNQMLVDFGTNGLNTDGTFDMEYTIDSLNQVVRMANGFAPSEGCSAGTCLEEPEEE
ncbi:MAG: hypothetical protein QME12_07035 [Nanoarchaeota archaeon]|nr:hypothetical protein [Nanoarchaeota archaeon]